MFFQGETGEKFLPATSVNADEVRHFPDDGILQRIPFGDLLPLLQKAELPLIFSDLPVDHRQSARFALHGWRLQRMRNRENRICIIIIIIIIGRVFRTSEVRTDDGLCFIWMFSDKFKAKTITVM